MIDFTNCKRIFSRAYNGANGKKIAVKYDGEDYMLKFPPSGQDKPTELSYTNSCVSEYLGSSIFNIIGIEAQKTLLGTYRIGGKEKIVCACKDFTADNIRLYDFCSIKNTVIDSGHGGTGTELEDITETMEKQQFVDPVELTEHFWNVFVVDALLGNFDRHNGNWGFIVNLESGKAKIAPIYDCGSCLLPQADENVMKAVLSDEEELDKRIFRFPTSAIQENKKKINYYDFMTDAKNADCNAAIARIYPQIDIEKIKAFIYETEGITELQKEFYSRYISARYDKILTPAYDIVMEQRNDLTLK